MRVEFYHLWRGRSTGATSLPLLPGQASKAILFIRDGLGAQTGRMYKPIPFVLSSRGYGMFVHTTAPLTLDMGHGYDQSHVIYSADDSLDPFVFLGDPKTVLTDYTAITSRSPIPPLRRRRTQGWRERCAEGSRSA
jgi:alpha-D-xyloside xylohydrolase